MTSLLLRASLYMYRASVMMTAIGASPHFGINTGRITATYSFALPLALLAFVLGPSEQLRQFVAGSFDGRQASRVAVTVLVLFL